MRLLDGETYSDRDLHVAHGCIRKRLAREKRDREDVLTAVSNDITPSPPASVELVNDDNMDGKEGWKRRRYGRAVCVMKMKKPGSYRVSTGGYSSSIYPMLIFNYLFFDFFKISNLDPSKFKMGLTIIEESLPNKSITQLSWPVEASSTSDDDNVDSEQQENESLHSEAEEANEMAVENEVHEEEEVELQAHQSAEFDQHSASIPANHDHQEEQEQQIQQQQKQEEEEVVDKEEEQVPLKIGDSTLSSKGKYATDNIYLLLC